MIEQPEVNTRSSRVKNKEIEGDDPVIRRGTKQEALKKHESQASGRISSMHFIPCAQAVCHSASSSGLSFPGKAGKCVT